MLLDNFKLFGPLGGGGLEAYGSSARYSIFLHVRVHWIIVSFLFVPNKIKDDIKYKLPEGPLYVTTSGQGVVVLIQRKVGNA